MVVQRHEVGVAVPVKLGQDLGLYLQGPRLLLGWQGLGLLRRCRLRGQQLQVCRPAGQRPRPIVKLHADATGARRAGGDDGCLVVVLRRLGQPDDPHCCPRDKTFRRRRQHGAPLLLAQKVCTRSRGCKSSRRRCSGLSRAYSCGGCSPHDAAGPPIALRTSPQHQHQGCCPITWPELAPCCPTPGSLLLRQVAVAQRRQRQPGTMQRGAAGTAIIRSTCMN